MRRWTIIFLILLIALQLVGCSRRGRTTANYYRGNELIDETESARNSILQKEYVAKIKTANCGDYVIFGSYEQDNNESNGKEDLEWIVLSVDNEKVKLVSRYAIACVDYNTRYENVRWESCYLKEWLNKEFYNSAFNEAEREMITPTWVATGIERWGYTGSDHNVVILKYDQHGTVDRIERCRETAYCRANGGEKVEKDGFCIWWLLPDPRYPCDAIVGRPDGNIHRFTGSDIRRKYAVRPVITINLDIP